MNKKIIILIVAALVVLCGLVVLAAVGSGPMAPLETASPASSAADSTAETPVAVTEDSMVEPPAKEPEVATGNIIFDGDNISVTGSGWGTEMRGMTVVITKGGAYHVSGTANDAQILVDAKKDAEVRLIFEDVDITYSQGAPINIQKAGLVVIELAEGTENFVTDAENYVFEEGKDEPDAAIFSKTDLTFMGSGSLTVNGNYDMAIHGKDTVGFTQDGAYNLTSVGDGVKGKEGVTVAGGVLNITAGGDGIQSNDTDLGFVTIMEGATLNITAGKDGIKGVSAVTVMGGNITIDAQEDGIQSDFSMQVEGGTLDIVTGGGSENAPEHVEQFGFPGWFNDNSTDTGDTASAKGLKAGNDLTISGGDITIDSMDDALHCGGELNMSDGTVTIATGDDAFHSDDRLTISGGTIDIKKSYEGLEGIFIEISGGDITLVASDDGLNAAGGSESDFEFMGPPGMSQAETLEEASYYIHITGGTLWVDAGGDGLDSNGALYVDGGEIYISGPTNSMNGALDYTTTGQINGGTVVAAGASGMAENFDSTSSQPSFRYVLTSYTTDECPITLTDSEGNVLIDVTMAKPFNSVVISSPDLKVGETYTLTCGLETVEVELTDTITNIGANGFGMGGPGGPGMGGPGMGGPPGGMPPR